MINIPIYRAKKLDSEEWVEGGLSPCGKYIVKYLSQLQKPYPFDEYILVTSKYDEIDPNTLAIHFPSMLDKNGKKIFASLSEDGVGGDTIEYTNKLDVTHVRTLQFTNLKLLMINDSSRTQIFSYCTLNKEVVIGIHKDTK